MDGSWLAHQSKTVVGCFFYFSGLHTTSFSLTGFTRMMKWETSKWLCFWNLLLCKGGDYRFWKNPDWNLSASNEFALSTCSFSSVNGHKCVLWSELGLLFSSSWASSCSWCTKPKHTVSTWMFLLKCLTWILERSEGSSNFVIARFFCDREWLLLWSV